MCGKASFKMLVKLIIGWTSLDIAASKSNFEIVKYLYKELAKTNPIEINLSTYFAAASGSLPITQYLLERDDDSLHFGTLLSAGANSGHANIIEYLLEKNDSAVIFHLASEKG